LSSFFSISFAKEGPEEEEERTLFCCSSARLQNSFVLFDKNGGGAGSACVGRIGLSVAPPLSGRGSSECALFCISLFGCFSLSLNLSLLLSCFSTISAVFCAGCADCARLRAPAVFSFSLPLVAVFCSLFFVAFCFSLFCVVVSF